MTRPAPYITHIQLNRPHRLNALTLESHIYSLFRAIGSEFQRLKSDSDCRAVVLSGSGRGFSSGLDCNLYSVGETSILMPAGSDPARKGLNFSLLVQEIQGCISSIEECGKPVIAAVHGACIGEAASILTACDIRFFAADVKFSMKDVDLGLVMDIGGLQRVEKIVGNSSWVREMAFTARFAGTRECYQFGLCAEICADKDKTLEKAIITAQLIAESSPIEMQAMKANVNFSRDHSVREGLSYAAMRQTTLIAQKRDIFTPKI